LRFFGGVAGMALLAFRQVGGGDMTSTEPTAGSADTEGQTVDAFIRRRRPPAPQPGGSGGGSVGSTGGSSGSTLTTEQVIRAAQTPDGAAIPQPSGPGGTCPEVVVRIGFWSCPTIGDSCTYSNSSGTHHCTCNRTDGEGQFPSWVCN